MPLQSNKPVNAQIKQLAQQMRSNVAFRKLTEVMEEKLQKAREDYEESPASEFNRGRVSELKDLINLFNS